jgi:hypothetical protein
VLRELDRETGHTSRAALNQMVSPR